MTEVDQMDVLCYIYAKKEVSASDLKKQFVEDKDAVIEKSISNGTLHNWLNEFEASEKIIRWHTSDRKNRRDYSHYRISEKYFSEIESRYKKREVNRRIENLSSEQISALLEKISELESENRFQDLSNNDNLLHDLIEKAEGYLNGKDEYEDEKLILKKILLDDAGEYGGWTRIKYVRELKGSPKHVVIAISKELNELTKKKEMLDKRPASVVKTC